MTLSDIYKYITDRFPYYRKERKRWQNSLRHNLSFNDCFVRLPPRCGVVSRAFEKGVKGCYWTLHPDCGDMFDKGSFLRRRKRFRHQPKGKIPPPLEEAMTSSKMATDHSSQNATMKIKASGVAAKNPDPREIQKKHSFTIESIISDTTDKRVSYMDHTPSSLMPFHRPTPMDIEPTHASDQPNISSNEWIDVHKSPSPAIESGTTPPQTSPPTPASATAAAEICAHSTVDPIWIHSAHFQIDSTPHIRPLTKSTTGWMVSGMASTAIQPLRIEDLTSRIFLDHCTVHRLFTVCFRSAPHPGSAHAPPIWIWVIWSHGGTLK